MKSKKSLFCLFTALFMTLVTGVFFYGFEIFNFQSPASQFLVFGFYGAAFFAVSRYKLFKNSLIVIPILFLLNFILIGRDLSPALILRDVLFISALCASIFLYTMFINSKIKIIPFVRAIVLGLINWFMGGLVLVILVSLFNSDSLDITNALVVNGNTSTLVGLGLGLGFDLYLKLENKFFPAEPAEAA